MTSMTDIDLLPLPEGESSSFGDYEVHDNETMIEYARANVARNTALLRAEIEALLEELDAMEAENEWLLAERDALTAEVERLREALRGWIWARENGASEGLAVQYAIAMLGDIHQIADAAMSKENRND